MTVPIEPLSPLGGGSMTGGPENLNAPITPLAPTDQSAPTGGTLNTSQSTIIGNSASSSPAPVDQTDGAQGSGSYESLGGGTSAAAASPTTSTYENVAASPQVNTPPGTATTGATGPTAASATGTTSATGPSDYASLSQALLGVTKPNSLNQYYNPTYHFRFFVTGDGDPRLQANNNVANITSGQVPQVTIVESGVTAVSFRSVEIISHPAPNGMTKDENATMIVMELIDPLGMSFFDGLLDAVKMVGGSNYTKMIYCLELTFRGYDEAGNAIVPSNLPNGGVWIYPMILQDFDVKMSEAGGIFTVGCVVQGSSSPLGTGNDEEKRTPNQALTVSGKTVAQIFQDLAAKLNLAWNNNSGGNLVRVAIVTHPIALGPAKGVDPGTFKLTSQLPFQSSQKTWQFDGGDSGSITCHIPPNASVSECITAILKGTEQAQALMKDQPITGQLDMDVSHVNSKGFREITTFVVEPVVSPVGFDNNSNNYIKQVTFHVVSHYTQNVILSEAQLAQASTPTVQNAMLQNLINNGLIQKRYDYIYTGLNTEVLDWDLHFDFTWQAIIPKLAGARSGYPNSMVNGVLNPGNVAAQGTLAQAPEVATDPSTVPVPVSQNNATTSGGFLGAAVPDSVASAPSTPSGQSPAISATPTPTNTSGPNTNTPLTAQGGTTV